MNIHLGWVGSETPDIMFSARDAVCRAAPMCTVTLHEGEDMIRSSWRDRMDAAEMRPHMRSDIQRHEILRQYGGLWLDADVTLLADPTTWAVGWTKYTIIKMFQRSNMFGSDLIYVPSGWAGWPIVEAAIQAVLDAEKGSYSLFAVAGGMTFPLAKQHKHLFNALPPDPMFPFDARKFTPQAVVARGFRPPPAAFGLGDLVAAGLSAVGITEERVSKILGRPCGCGARAEALNRLGERLGFPRKVE